jgi:cobalt-precorrin-5B (C1)-methyltransferase
MARKPSGPLRRGWTTGACATAATRAAYTALLTGQFPDPVAITLPGGEAPSFALAQTELSGESAMAAIVKDAGDDPDVTHCALIKATLCRGTAGSGVAFRAGEGVGTVRRAGLALSVGEPAINPAPRRMMERTVAELAAQHGDGGDVEIEISIPGGAALAERTMNGRLGIEGGLSVLGTTGIVIPFSCASWIATIRQGIDVARAGGITHAAGSTGRTSEAAVRRMYGLEDIALLDMGDFAGGLLKYLRDNPIPRLTIAGGFAKIAKLAAGNLDLHSGRSQIDFDLLADWLAALGGDQALVAGTRGANAAAEVLEMAKGAALPLGDDIAAKARATACAVVGEMAGSKIEIEVVIFGRDQTIEGRSSGWRQDG